MNTYVYLYLYLYLYMDVYLFHVTFSEEQRGQLRRTCAWVQENQRCFKGAIHSRHKGAAISTSGEGG